MEFLFPGYMDFTFKAQCVQNTRLMIHAILDFSINKAKIDNLCT